jgi:hypothetical protein
MPNGEHIVNVSGMSKRNFVYNDKKLKEKADKVNLVS